MEGNKNTARGREREEERGRDGRRGGEGGRKRERG